MLGYCGKSQLRCEKKMVRRRDGRGEEGGGVKGRRDGNKKEGVWAVRWK